jgi:hypothetical protein
MPYQTTFQQHVAQSSASIGGACFAMSEATGQPAALSLVQHAIPRPLPEEGLQTNIERRGAILTP